ncbi:MAG: T9SS type A sorting domain-containing protein [Flavobacteriales bacterium]
MKHYLFLFSTLISCLSVFSNTNNQHQASDTTLFVSICEGHSVQVGAASYSIAGFYSDTLVSQSNEDSIVNLNLSVLPSISCHQQNISTERCSYVINHQTFYADTTFVDTLTSFIGCDSVVEYILSFETTDEEDFPFEHRKIILGTHIQNPNILLPVDFDADGDIDLFSTSTSNQLVYLENTGDEHYKHSEIETHFTNITQMESVDYDADGDLDVLVVYSNDFCNSNLGLIRNNACHFSDLMLESCIKSFDVGDLDTNELEDIVFVDSDAQIQCIYNGLNIEHLGETNLYTKFTKLVDYDGDGLQDLLLFDAHNMFYYKNQNNNSFDFIIKKRYKIDGFSGQVKQLEATDINNDGQIDVVYSVINPFYLNSSAVMGLFVSFLNDSGAYTSRSLYTQIEDKSMLIGVELKFCVGSINQSQNRDIALKVLDNKSILSLNYYQTTLNTNFNKIQLHKSSGFSQYAPKIKDLHIVDYNLDNKPDLMTSFSQNNNLISVFEQHDFYEFESKEISNNNANSKLNLIDNQKLTSFIHAIKKLKAYRVEIDTSGGSKLVNSPQFDDLTIDSYSDIHKHGNLKEIDFDADGDMDLILSDVNTEVNYLFENQDGSFALHSSTLVEHLDYNVFSFEDVDGDGDLDMMLDKGFRWKENQNGNFAPAEAVFNFTLPDNTSVLECTDLDGDQDKDLILARHFGLSIYNPYQEILVYKNTDGTSFQYAFSNFTSQSLALNDIDLDGDFDLFFDDNCLENLGEFNFEHHDLSALDSAPKGFYDIDSDGFTDILVKQNDTLSWFLKDEDFGFDEQRIISTNADSYDCDLQLLDVDEDGDMDVLSARNQKTNDSIPGNIRNHLELFENREHSPNHPSTNTENPEDSDSPFLIFPNPNTGTFFVQSFESDISLMVISLDGKILKTEALQIGNSKINIGNTLPAGVYILSFMKKDSYLESLRVVVY